MKKLKTITFLILILILLGCKGKYSEIKPEKPLLGTTVSVDSTQWKPVLIQEKSEESFMIASEGQIYKIYIWDPVDTFLLGVLLGVGFTFSGIIIAKIQE